MCSNMRRPPSQWTFRIVNVHAIEEQSLKHHTTKHVCELKAHPKVKVYSEAINDSNHLNYYSKLLEHIQHIVKQAKCREECK